MLIKCELCDKIDDNEVFSATAIGIQFVTCTKCHRRFQKELYNILETARNWITNLVDKHGYKEPE